MEENSKLVQNMAEINPPNSNGEEKPDKEDQDILEDLTSPPPKT